MKTYVGCAARTSGLRQGLAMAKRRVRAFAYRARKLSKCFSPCKRYFHTFTIECPGDWERLLGKPRTLTEVLFLRVYYTPPPGVFLKSRAVKAGGPMLLATEKRKVLVRGDVVFHVTPEAHEESKRYYAERGLIPMSAKGGE